VGKYKRKRGWIGNRRRKESGGQREGRTPRQRKINKAKMVNRKNTEVQEKCEIAKKEGRVRKKVGRKGRTERGKVRKEKGRMQRNRTERKRRAQNWKKQK